MAETERQRIVDMLFEMKLSSEDMLHMIQLNCNCAPNMAGYKTLIDICARAMTYGAMVSMCPDCKMILHEDGDIYRCLAMLSMQCECNYAQYVVKTASTPWYIPESIENQDLKKCKRRHVSFKAKSFLDKDMIEQRQGVIDDINGLKELPDNIRVYKRDDGILYNYFLVFSDDFTGKASHVLGRIEEDIQLMNSNDYRFRFYKKEKIFQTSSYHATEMSTLKIAMSRFKNEFLTSSGINWEDSLEGVPNRKKKRMFPLKMDFYSTLSYEEAEKVDDVHKQLVVKLDFLKKLEIEGKQIREELIKIARTITVEKIQWAHDILVHAKNCEDQGKCPGGSCALKNQLRLLVEEKDPDLKSLSIIARMIALPGGTTVRLVDITRYRDLEQIKRILDVFFDYHNAKEDWPILDASITHGYMMDRTLRVVSKWIMKLVFSSDEVHHHYVNQKSSSSCYWSVLLRKAEKEFDQSSSNLLILCTIDVEKVSGSDKNEDEPMMDKQMSKKIFLSEVDDNDYDKYGYLVDHAHRAKLHMIFPIRYSRSGSTLCDSEQASTWTDFIDKFYSGGTISTALKTDAKKILKLRRSPYIYRLDRDTVSKMEEALN